MAKRNNYVLIIVFVFMIVSIFTLTIGYSLHSTILAIDGRAAVKPLTTSGITSVKLKGVNEGGIVRVNTKNSEKDIISEIELPNENSSVTYTVTLTNFSSGNMVLTSIENKLYNNDNIEYVLSNIKVNETIIKPSSQHTFEITFKYKKKPIENKVLNFNLGFKFNDAPIYTFKITSDKDSIIKVINNGKEIMSDNGVFMASYKKGTNIKWTVNKEGFYGEEGTVSLNKDELYNITLKEKPLVNISVTPSPGDSVVTIREGSKVLKTGYGTQSVMVKSGSEIMYSVSKYNYSLVEKTITVGEKDETISVELSINNIN